MKFKSIIASVLSLACAACALTARAATVNVSDLTPGETKAIDGTLNMDADFDLGTSTLTLTGVSGIAGAGVFKGSAGSILDIEITASVTMVNLQGGMKLVKRGAGTLSLAKNPEAKTDFSGGTEVWGGVLTTERYGSYYLEFGNPPNIEVHTGGELQLHGCYGFTTDHVITLAGGTLGGGRNDGTSTHYVKPALILTANSKYAPTTSMSLGSSINLGNHELEVSVSGSSNWWAPAVIENGTINVTKGTLTLLRGVGSSTASLTLGAKTKIVGDFTYSVKDLLIDSTASVAGPIHVYGAYRLDENGTVCDKVVMQGGSTLDLISVGRVLNIAGLQFADGAAVKIEIGNREVPDDGMLIEWNMTQEALNGRSFELVRNGEAVEDLSLVWNENGVAVKDTDTVMAFAEWTGAAHDGNLANVANWNCTTKSGKVLEDLIPDGATAVKIPYDKLGTFNFPVDATLAYTSIELTGEIPQTAVELAYDCDWRGLGEQDFLFPIDLKGHKLSIALPSGDSPSENPGSVTSTGDTLGELNATVAAGQSYNNTNIVFSGNMKFVKDGAGTFVAAQYPQEYTGETVVDGGVLKCANKAYMNSEDGKSPFGSTCTVTVNAGASIDPAGSYAWAYHTIILNGGRISNTVAQSGEGSNHTGYNTTYFDYPFNPTIVMNEDSMLVSSGDFNFTGTLRGNGCTLTVDSKTTRWASHDSDEVTVVFTGSTIVKTLKHFAENESQMTVEMMDGTKFDVGGNWAVSNYIAKATSAISNYRGDANEKFKLTIYGTFRPETSDFLGCVMQNGATLDLTAQDGSFNLYNPLGQKNLANGATPWLCQYVTFANNAAVTIDVHGREFTDEEKVVEWSAVPMNLEGLTFELDDASKTAGYKIKKTDEGLFVLVDTGSEMTVEEIKGALPKGLDGVEIDWTKKTAAEIKEILNAKADNGLSVNENIILGIPQEENGQFKKKPYLKAYTGAGVENGKIKFAFGGISPKTGKADIEFEILSASCAETVAGGSDSTMGGAVAGGSDSTNGGWKQEVSGKLNETDPVAELPTAGEGQSAVKYYKVHFSVSEKAKTAE